MTGCCLPPHLATVPLGGVQHSSLCISRYVDAPASNPPNAVSAWAELHRFDRQSRAQTFWFCVLRGVRTLREYGCILLGVCRQTMHILMLHWLALLRQTCCSRIIWCSLHVQITPELEIVKNIIFTYVCMGKNAKCFEESISIYFYKRYRFFFNLNCV